MKSLELGLLVYQLYTRECLLVMCISFRCRSFTLVHYTADMGPTFTQNGPTFAVLETFTDKVIKMQVPEILVLEVF